MNKESCIAVLEVLRMMALDEDMFSESEEPFMGLIKDIKNLITDYFDTKPYLFDTKPYLFEELKEGMYVWYEDIQQIVKIHAISKKFKVIWIRCLLDEGDLKGINIDFKDNLFYPMHKAYFRDSKYKRSKEGE